MRSYFLILYFAVVTVATSREGEANNSSQADSLFIRGRWWKDAVLREIEKESENRRTEEWDEYFSKKLVMMTAQSVRITNVDHHNQLVEAIVSLTYSYTVLNFCWDPRIHIGINYTYANHNIPPKVGGCSRTMEANLIPVETRTSMLNFIGNTSSVIEIWTKSSCDMNDLPYNCSICISWPDVGELEMKVTQDFLSNISGIADNWTVVDPGVSGPTGRSLLVDYCLYADLETYYNKMLDDIAWYTVLSVIMMQMLLLLIANDDDPPMEHREKHELISRNIGKVQYLTGLFGIIVVLVATVVTNLMSDYIFGSQQRNWIAGYLGIMLAVPSVVIGKRMLTPDR